MGAISTKPRLKPVAVNNATMLSAVGSAVMLIAAAALTRYTAKSKSFTKLASLSTLGSELKSLQHQHTQSLRAQPGLSEIEVLKQSTFRAVIESSAMTATAEILSVPARALAAATSPTEVAQASKQLLEVVKANHQQAQITNFHVVAMNAFKKIGFNSVEELPGSAHRLRLVGRDESGRTLVTEFESHAERGESVSSEVLGVCHSESEQLLEEFEQALEEEGVIGVQPSRRKTGGVAQLEAAREFIRRPLTKVPMPIEQGERIRKSTNAHRKSTQQNNQRNRQRQR